MHRSTVTIGGRELPLLTREEARERGFGSITAAFCAHTQQDGIGAVLASLRGAECEVALMTSNGPGSALNLWVEVVRTKRQTVQQAQRAHDQRTMRRLRNMWLNPEPSAL
jgi:hypothetical protein